MTRPAHVRRRWRLGIGFRVAVLLLWPIMELFTKRDWRNTQVLEVDPGGIIIAPNHNTWIDPIVISHALWNNDRPPRFLAKESVFRVPVVGAIIRSAGQIPVYRESHEAVVALRDAISAVEQGECVVVYPEGTITRDPDLWPMAGKTGAVRIALTSGRPLIPVAQWGGQEIMRPYVKELRLLPRKTLHVWFGDPLDLSDLKDRPLDAETLRIGTDRLMAAITDLLAQIREQSPPGDPMSFRGGQVPGA